MSPDDAPATGPDLGAGWKPLATTAAAALAVVGTFVFAPPFVGVESWVGFGKFLVAALIGLSLIPIAMLNEKRHLVWWMAASVCFLASSSIVFAIYQNQLTHYTRPYTSKELVVIGSKRSSEGEKAAAENRQEGRSDDDTTLIQDAAGRVDEIWPSDEIASNQLKLAISYCLCDALFSLSMVSIVQTIALVRSGKKS